MTETLTVNRVIAELQLLADRGFGDYPCEMDERGPVKAVRLERHSVTFDWLADR